jgi:beta-N-acetylhexosaminidase
MFDSIGLLLVLKIISLLNRFFYQTKANYNMCLGPVMLGLEGLMLNAEEKEILRHPVVGGVILFTRNYQSPEQVAELIRAVHGLRQPRLLIAVDQEGGRVQRFQRGFTRLPALRSFGENYDRSPIRAVESAYLTGWLMATELRAVGVDFSFAPVLDLDRGLSQIIGDRAFHGDPQVVTQLAMAYMDGMQKAGMAAVGKHFPGHGGVVADSHVELPIDNRSLTSIIDEDLVIFQRMVDHGIAAIMPAHVVFPHIDIVPAGFSIRWLKEILRQRLGFQGVIISDDLDMQGSWVMGSPPERAQAALAAGCDMVLACNDRQAAMAILDHLKLPADNSASLRCAQLRGRNPLSLVAMRQSQFWQRAAELVQNF